MHNKENLLIGRYDWAVFSGLFVHAFFLQMLPIILLAVSIDLGFSFEEGGFAKGGLIQVFGGITGVLSVLSCSFLASRYGKRTTFTAALVAFLIGIVFLSTASSYTMYVLMMMLTGAGGGIIIGLAPAIAHDLHPDDSGKYLTIANSFWSAGMLLTVLLAGYLLSNGVSWNYIVC